MATLAGRAAVLGRVALALAVASLNLILAALSTSGFVRPELLWAGLVLGLTCAATMVAAVGHWRRAVRAAAVASGAQLREVLTQGVRVAPLRTSAGVGLVLLAVTGAVLAGIFSPVVVAAHILGDPQRAKASSSYGGGDCSRCHSFAEATFTTASGSTATAQLAAPLQGGADYESGITVVYDGDHPTRAMAAGDYRLGHGPGVTVAAVVGLLLPSAALTLAAALARRRRVSAVRAAQRLDVE